MMATAHGWTELPIPDFYDPANASSWAYSPDQQRLFEAAVAWREIHAIPPAEKDEFRIHLLLIDFQKDFCFPEGSLYVGGRSGTGALEDNDRIAQFMYRNLRAITHITCTLDTHHPYQIFSPAFWLDADGNPPTPHREITAADVKAGRMRPNPALASWLGPGDYDWLVREVTHYCEQLEAAGKYRLYLWPPHCILGSAGHSLVGVVHEARMFHSYARLSRAEVQVKGTAPLTEYYSMLAPEVLIGHDGRPLAERNVEFLEVLLESDAVVIAGQAASHCVKSTIEDLLGQIDRELVNKVYILRDCMSSVAVPDPAQPGEFAFDFTPQAEEALARFADAGMHVVESTRPLSEWPDLGR